MMFDHAGLARAAAKVVATPAFIDAPRSTR